MGNQFTALVAGMVLALSAAAREPVVIAPLARALMGGCHEKH